MPRRSPAESVTGSGDLSVTGLPADNGTSAQIIQDGRPRGFWGLINAHGSANAYGFARLDDGAPTTFPELDGAPEVGDGIDLAAYEVMGRTDVPTDGSAKVWLEPLQGAPGLAFVYPGPGTLTTTTASPCTGSCSWTYTASTKTWAQTSSTCGTGCKCLAPTFCPEADSTTTTDCGRLTSDQTAPACGGATTTGGPCSTTTSSACVAGCQWYCHPTNGWVLTSNGCSSICPCPAPSGGCTACDTASTSCVYTPPSCNGSCRWIWTGTAWSKVSDGCSGTNVPNCYCDAPAGNGTTCAQETSTSCYVHGGSGADPCYPPRTTTTAGPGCSGTCLWMTSDGTAFDTIIRSCPGCDCATPITTPPYSTSVVETPCQAYPTTTTTTTTTTAAPTTTTTAGPSCTFCRWTCSCPGCTFGAGTGTWSMTTACATGCTCPGQPPVDCTFKYHTAVVAVRCVGPGTTTTAAPTTTTTTTTTAGGTSWYLHSGGTCGSPGSCVNNIIPPPTCSGPVAGPYTDCLTCRAANPGATGPCM